MIDIRDAFVSYGEAVALRGVSLSVEANEFVGIIGPNGAGKTTLLTVVNGLTRLSGGSARVLGDQLTPGNGHSLRKRAGYVSQLQNIDPRMPMLVRDVVMIGRYAGLGLFKRPGQVDRNTVDEILALVGMEHLADRPIGHLSGGEQQRIAIARCLAQEPELFLLDEPTASLDWKARVEILKLVKQMHDARRLTTLYVTHDLSTLPQACDRVILMKNGFIEADGTPEKMLTDHNLSRLYDMPVEAVRARRGEIVTNQR